MKKFFVNALVFCCLVITMQAQGQTNKKPVAASKSSTTSKSSVPAASMERGKQVYQLYCLTCHQADGSGVPNLNPPIVKTKWVLGNKTPLIQMVLKGSQGKVEIEGETFHNTMPAQNTLTDQQIADVLTYVRNSFGNKASAVTAAEVKTQRAKTK
ncbi:MAG: cytochrome c [Flavisolibacter sp.]|nr:cytochrome c [Flavisolibacter sp.]MBD0294119.1 cytochrome c [Flavisolibacter sp.]MBD0367355.1 cytochrome c [Flavisolibacter sp.]